MKKVVALVFLFLSLTQARMFIGVDGGYNVYGRSLSGDTFKSSVWHNQKPNGWYAGLNFGSEFLANDYFGFRVFVDGGFSKGLNISQITIASAGLNADMLVNFVATSSFSLGVFVGAGAGYEYVMLGSNARFSSIPVYGRVGVTMGLGQNSRIDITARPPIVSYQLDKNARFASSSFLLQVGYKYIF